MEVQNLLRNSDCTYWKFTAHAKLAWDLENDSYKSQALETGASTTDIVSKKQALRDAPADSAIASADTEAKLKAQWNTSILGDSPYS